MTEYNDSSAPGNGDATTSSKKFQIKPHWKLRWLTRLARLQNGGKFSPAAGGMALALAESFYEKPLAEASCSFLAQKVGLSKRSAVRGIGELERVPDTVIVRVRGQWEGRVKSRYAMVLTPEDLGPKDAAEYGVTGPVASDELWVSSLTPNITNSAKPREAEVVSADAAGAPEAPPRAAEAVSEDVAPNGVASDAVRRKLFEAFWAAYPRKEGRAGAKKEFDAALARDVPVETIMGGVRRYAAAKAKVDPNWLKYPATWLRDECWTEDPKPPRPKPERASKASKGNGRAEPAAFADGDDLTGRRVRHRQNGIRGECIRDVVDVGDGRLMVSVVHDGAVHVYCVDDLVFEDSPPKRDGKAAAVVETPEQVAAREVGFPIGSVVRDRSTGKSCVVTRVEHSDDGSFKVWSGGVGLPADRLVLEEFEE
jgi:hypothetical protein